MLSDLEIETRKDKVTGRTERFWSKVRKTAGCWIWEGAKTRDGGYGTFCFRRRMVGAHRVAYELEYGPIPPGIFILHRCDNPQCVRPDHLFTGTHADNMKDREDKGRVAKGVAQSAAKFSDADVSEIRRQSAAGVFQRILAARFGVDQTTISKIVTCESWKHIPHGQEDPKRDRTARGERQGSSKLTERDVLELRRLKMEGVSPPALAARFQIHKHTVFKILRRETWAHL